MKKTTLLSAFLLGAITSCFAQQVYVDKTASGLNDGTSWADAYTSLQTAIANTSSGQIWVKAATYYPGSPGQTSTTFTLKNNVEIYGGFNGTETSLMQRDLLTNVTTLSGDLDQSGTNNSSDAYHVVTTANTNSSAVLDGFVIKGGYAYSPAPTPMGGGIYCAPTLTGAAFDPVIRNCEITGNQAQQGGGVYVQGVTTGSAAPQFLNCRFHNNQALTGAGGAMFFSSSGGTTFCLPHVESCLFYYNSTAGNDGNSIFADESSGGEVHAVVTNCTFGNPQDFTGSAIHYNWGGGSGTFELYNNILYNAILQVTGTTFSGNNNCIDAAYLPLISGASNSSFNPLFVDGTNYDFHLTCPSPCVGGGENADVNVTYDIGGNVRLAGTNVDIGCYEMLLPNVVANGSATDVCPGTFVTLYGSGATTYTWDNSVTDNVGFNIGGPGAYFYNVTGTDASGCSNVAQYAVNVFTPPTVTANVAGPSTVCAGDAVILYGSGSPATYIWSTGATDNTPYNVTMTDTYTVTATDVQGCVSTATITITADPPVIGLSAGTDMDMCRVGGGPDITLIGTVGTATSVSWTTLGTGSFVNNTSATPDYFPSGADFSSPSVLLVLSGTMPGVCPAVTDTMQLSFWDPASILAGADFSVCDNAGTVSLDGSATTNYSTVTWTSAGSGTFAAPGNVTTTYTPAAPELVSGSAHFNLTAYALNSVCASVSDSVIVTFLQSPVVTGLPDITICETDSIYLHETVTGGLPPYTYYWQNSVATTLATNNTSYYTPVTTDFYYFSATDANGCQVLDDFQGTFNASKNISGAVTTAGSPVTNGTVYLIRYIPQQQIFDTVNTYTLGAPGTYFFGGAAFGNYIIKAVADTNVYPNLLPTYYGDVFQWDSATVVSQDCITDFTADIHTIALLGGSGVGSISGFILEDVGYGTRYAQGGHHDHVLVPGGPLKGIDVKLGKNPSGGIQARTSSDSTGHYGFYNLPDDSYRIYVDIPGLPMDSFYIVTINTALDTAVNLNYYADSNSVYPILPTAVGLPSHKYAAEPFDVYPNPAKDFTSLRFEVSDQNTATIRVLDITGEAVLTTQLRSLPKGKHEYQFNFSNGELKSGIYFIELQNGAGVQVKKLVVEQ